MAVLQVILQFCSRFELQHGGLGKLNIAAESMRIQYSFDVVKTVPAGVATRTIAPAPPAVSLVPRATPPGLKYAVLAAPCFRLA
ncbi:hypothetical protein UP10_41725 [Bradyrhizobium sp. LTSPM299]|nr:hypothetical protein UP10_41725 [Bradyrhizobium sp. LTSPM299]